MAIYAGFNAELVLVDPARSFTYNSGYSDYGENEWSVSGWTVRGGSDAACEHGASEAMFQMGYIWATPEKTVRPATLPAGGITLPRQEFVFPYFRMFYNYGYGAWSSYKGPSFNKWIRLNCAWDTRIPHGHAWPAIISAIDAEDSFFTNNPTYVTGSVGSTSNSFNLNLSEPDYTTLVNRVAAHCVTTLNEYNRRNFDPQDGSNWTSDQVCGFANAVVSKARETVSDAELNIYAYAGHRRAPSFPIPHINVQVTLGFNDAGIGYPALVDEWGQVAKRVDLRGYGFIAAWDAYGPFGSLASETGLENHVQSYSSYIASGCKGLNMESSGHNVPGLIGHYRLMRYMRDGVATLGDVRDLFETSLPDFTSETKALYEFWARSGRNTVAMSGTYDLIDALPDNALSTEIKTYWTWYRFVEEHVKGHLATHGKDGKYYSLLERSLRFCKALQDDGSLHGYTYSRQEANSNVQPDRPDLAFDADAHWLRYGEYPPDSLYQELKATEQIRIQRPVELEDTTLALCEVVPNYPSDATFDADFFFTETNNAEYAFIGPGSVTTDAGTTAYGAGKHMIRARGMVRFSGGILFMNSFPVIRSGAGQVWQGERRWLYVPKMTRGRVDLSSNVRIVLWDVQNEGQREIKEARPPFTAGMYDPRDLLAGPLMFNAGLTKDEVRNVNCNPWISPHFNRALMPKALALREGVTILAQY